MRCGETQLGRNRFTKVGQFLRTSIIFNERHSILMKSGYFQKRAVILAKKTKGVHQEGGELVYFKFRNSCFCSSLMLPRFQMAQMRPSSKVNMNERNAARGLSHTEPKY